MSQPTQAPTPTPAGGSTPPMSDAERDIYAIAEAVGGTVFDGEQ